MDEADVPVTVLTSPPSEEEFVQNYLSTGKPVILRNTSEWPALRKWTLPYLRDKVGHHSVHVRKNVHTETYKVGTKYNIEQMSFSSCP